MDAMKTKTIRALATLVAAAALGGCGGEELLGYGCAAVVYPAVMVEVRDAAGAPAAMGAWLVARDGAYADSATADVTTGNLEIGVALERAGRYDVTVRKAGFKTWTRADVVVTRGLCNVRTAELTAVLEPG
jgi:hypothetical protein